jgi:hypothetical protein
MTSSGLETAIFRLNQLHYRVPLGHYVCLRNTIILQVGYFWDAFSITGCTESTNRMVDELERIWKEVVIEVFSWGTEENHEPPNLE